jgi:hypothetical protein
MPIRTTSHIPSIDFFVFPNHFVLRPPSSRVTFAHHRELVRVVLEHQTKSQRRNRADADAKGGGVMRTLALTTAATLIATTAMPDVTCDLILVSNPQAATRLRRTAGDPREHRGADVPAVHWR